MQFILFLVAWVGSTTTLIVYPLKHFDLLRVTEEEETVGMDDSKHNNKI